jgi:hypothetical protein
MDNRSSVTETRRALVQSADAWHEKAKTYSNARQADGAAFDAWCGHMTAANFANVIAAMLRQVAADHGEEYTARLVAIVTGAENDGEDAYFANDDVRFNNHTTEESK